MKYKLTDQNWDGIVLDQPWPKPVDLDGKLHKKFTIRVRYIINYCKLSSSLICISSILLQTSSVKSKTND